MRALKLFTFAVVVFVLTIGVSAQHETAQDIEDGGRAFRNTCANCHGPDGDQVSGIVFDDQHPRHLAPPLAILAKTSRSGSRIRD